MHAQRAVVAIIGVVALCGCSSSKAARNQPTVPTTTATSTPAVTSPPPAGLPAFYGVPDPLPAGQPGDVVRNELVAVAGLHGTMRRVMYHSRSLRGDDIVVTGLIAVPQLRPPPGGFPVITFAHGTTGIADLCAPSLYPDANTSTLNALLDRGYVVTATDFEGLGTPGRHPYIVGESEARGVLDIVRAARKLADAHASDRYLVWGHSQGGHAAMFALHIADQWSPELHLVGVVAGAPPSQLQFIQAALQKSPFAYYLLMAAAGINAAYGDQRAPLDAVLTPAGVADVALVDQGCTGQLAATFAGKDVTGLIKADPAKVPSWAALLAANDPGQFAAPSPEPLLIIQGGSDEQIPVVSTQLLFAELCKIGQTEQRWIYPGQSHAGVIAVSIQDMLHWIADRFASKPAPDPIQPAGEPGVQTSRCPT